MNGSHAAYIFAAYAIAVAVVAILTGSIMLEHRALKRDLAKFPAREGGEE